MQQLQINRTVHGFEQRSVFRNADLYHEEVNELEAGSVWQTRFGSGTQVLTFLLLGDQNAGKSTFLHAWTHDKDKNFMRLFSLLPMLVSSFINTRFLPSDSDESAVMDEPPFIDTDIAAGTMLISLENFLFFLSEYDIDASPFLQTFPSDTQFVCIQLIEVGGDHLDRIVAMNNITRKRKRDEHKQQLDDEKHEIMEVVHRSNRLISCAKKSIYFINCTDLFTVVPADDENSRIQLELKPQQYQKLIERFTYLSAAVANQQGHEVLIYVSRLPYAAQQYKRVAVLNAKEISAPYAWTNEVIAQLSDAYSSLTEWLQLLLTLLSKTLQWRFIISGARAISHINTQNELVPNEVCLTLVRLFQSEMTYSISSPVFIATKYLFDCWKDTSLRFDEDDVFSLWLDSHLYAEHLEALEFLEVPDYCLVREYGAMTDKLVSHYYALRHHHHNFVHSLLWFNFGSSKFGVWASRDCIKVSEDETLPLPHEQQTEVRFPYHHSFFTWLQRHMEQNLPGEFWFAPDFESLAALYARKYGMDVSGDDNDASSSSDMKSSIQETREWTTGLRAIIDELVELVLSRWHVFQNCTHVDKTRERFFNEWIWGLEEWAMAKYLLESAINPHKRPGHSLLEFPTIPCTVETWQSHVETIPGLQEVSYQVHSNRTADQYQHAITSEVDYPYRICLSFGTISH